jgi:hydrogenase expression/formation protein HypD
VRFVDEFRDPEMARALAGRIAGLCEPGRHYKFMEVCGGHTHTIYKHGLEDYLPANVTLVHGPGCPVCVIPMGRVDDAIHIAEQPDVILTSFGDMMRVPGGGGSFFDSSARGADIRMVYSPLDALKIARQNPWSSWRSGSRPRRPPPRSPCCGRPPRASGTSRSSVTT